MATIRERYDDGGFSGGTLERPALKQMIADIESGLIDVIVVYKIDRLSRSLMDFAKLVEVFDRNNVTFVSVTQSFNTTTSMGRLTLNILLSFAQFEREVIGERIRDKFAASRKRGIWMGGFVPMGYDVKDRKLVVNAAEAATVQMIFERFVAIGSASTLARALQVENVRNKRGKRIDKGFLYKLIKNRVYLGEAVHKGTSYTGEHEAIITQDLWDAVHAILKESPRVRGAKNRVGTDALLKGLIFAANGPAMTPTFTRKGERLYRYYVSMDLLRNRERPEGAGPARLPAAMVEGAVVAEMRRLIASPEVIAKVLETCRQESDRVDERSIVETLRNFNDLWNSLFPAEQARIVKLLVDRVTVSASGLVVDLRNNGIATLVRDMNASISREAAE
jgi:site-specific DNA recombinase